MNYRLIKLYPFCEEQLGDIITAQSDAYKKYPEYWEPVKEPQFKVGDWIIITGTPKDHSKWIGWIDRIKSIDNYINTEGQLEYARDGLFFNKEFTLRLATPQEIETHLIAEAKKRGFTKGTNYRYPDRPNLGIREIESGDFGYNAEFDTLHDKGFHSYNIYYQGKWAEITKEEQIKIGEYVAKFSNNTVSFGCKKYTFSEITSLYGNCLTFGINSILTHNHTVDFMVIKKVYETIKKNS